MGASPLVRYAVGLSLVAGCSSLTVPMPLPTRGAPRRHRVSAAPCRAEVCCQLDGAAAPGGEDGAAPAEPAREWGDDGFGEPAWGETPGESAPPQSDAVAWGDDDAGMWGTGPPAGGAAPVGPLDPFPTAPPPPPPRERKPIETTKVGIVTGPHKRRNGYHIEVAVQHPGATETMHRLWLGFEVLKDVAYLRSKVEIDVDVDRFGEAVLEFLQAQGVDLADPDWGMQDDSIPFSTDYLPMRILFAYYPEMPEALAAAVLGDDGERPAVKVPPTTEMPLAAW